MGVKADFAALRDVSDRMRQIRQNLRPVAATRIAAAFHKQIQDQFKRSVDPYDKPWKPVVRNRRRDRRARAARAAKGLPVRADKPLIDTGRMRASIVSRAVGSEVRVAIPVDYAVFHQEGTRRIARRQMLPEMATGGLGPRWTIAANKEALAVLKMMAEGG